MSDNKDLIQILKQSQDMILTLNEAIRDLKPMAEFGEKVIADERFYSMKEASDIIEEKIMEETGAKIGRNKLFQILRDLKILSSNDSNRNAPYRNFIDMGIFHVKLKETPVGFVNVTLVTGKGLDYIQKKVGEYLCS